MHGRMRRLTSAEARAIGLLLAVSGDDTTASRRAPGLPRSTFQAIRQRLQGSGWIKERYIPSPRATGCPGILVSLSLPFVERRLETLRRLRNRLGTVVLWVSPSMLLCVSYCPTPTSTDHEIPSDWLRQSWTFYALSNPTDVPVYFDYQGAWSTLAGLRLSESYPKPLPAGPVGLGLPDDGELRSLVSRPFNAIPGPRLLDGLRPWQLTRRQRRMLRDGWVARRFLPDFAAIPSYNGARVESAVFLTGKLIPNASLRDLRIRLLERLRVAPFLALQENRRILIAMLSPAPSSLESTRPPVSEVFQAALRDIEVIREPLDSLFPLIDHRYDMADFEPPP